MERVSNLRHGAVAIGTQTFFPAAARSRAHHSQTPGAGRETLGARVKLVFPASAKAALTDDAVYGWHLDLEVEAKFGSGGTRRAGYRCLFVVENRETPLFLAVVER